MAAQRAVDDAAREAVTPFLAERDDLTARIGEANSALANVAAAESQRGGLDALLLRREDARRDVEVRQQEVERLQVEQPTRDAVIQEVGTRFESILTEVGFPDLEEAGIDTNYAPLINRRHYSAETSSGAQTLISVCWQLAVFEVLLEGNRSHPGHLMIDSIQKGLAQQPIEGADDRYPDPAIVERLYDHVSAFASGQNGDAQIIIVDNTPPERHRDAIAIAIEFTRDPDNPPYGLIEDAIPGASDSSNPTIDA